MKKRILIGYMSYNICQEAIANSLFDCFNEKGKYEVRLVNFYSYFNCNLGETAKLDFLYGFLYGKVAKNTSKIFTRNFDYVEIKKLFKSFNPDVVISTHFYVNYITSFFNKENMIDSKIISFVPDYSCHSWWVANKDDIDYYLVNCVNVKQEFLKCGVSDKKIVLFDIPFKLDQDISKDVLAKRYNLNHDKSIYLFLSGSNDDYDYFKDLVKRKYDFSIVFVCGNNIFLKDKCEKFIRDNDIRNVVVLSFVKDVFYIMNISDVVITKPSGCNLMYITKFKKPSILLPGSNPIQRKNSNFFCKKNYSAKINSPYALSKKVSSFLNYPFIVKSMANKLNKFDNGYFFKVITNLIEKISVR